MLDGRLKDAAKRDICKMRLNQNRIIFKFFLKTMVAFEKFLTIILRSFSR